jgi:hypothetical protein
MSAREAVVTMVAVWSMFTKLVARVEATDASAVISPMGGLMKRQGRNLPVEYRAWP